MPSELGGRLRAWKKSGYEVYSVNVASLEEPFYIRALTREEYEALVDGLDIGSYYPRESSGYTRWPPPVLALYGTCHYEEILRAGLLHPQLTGEMPAGVDAHVASAIVTVSGWADRVRLVEEMNVARQKATSLWGFLESRILQAFPAMSPERTGKMVLSEFLYRAAMSEIMTGVEIDMRPWLDPDAYMKELEREQKRARRQQSVLEEAPVSRADARSRARLRQEELIRLAEQTPVDLTARDTKPNFARDNSMLSQI